MKIANTTNNNVAKDLATNVAASTEPRKRKAKDGWFDSDKFFSICKSITSNEGKGTAICKKAKKLLTDALSTAPDVLTEQPSDAEIALSPEQMIGNASREMLFESRRRALERSNLDETTKFNKARQIDDMEQVIKDSVDLLAKGKYATKGEIEMMLARITAVESGIGYEVHEQGVDEHIQAKIDDILSGIPEEKKAFSFEEAFNGAGVGFNI